MDSSAAIQVDSNNNDKGDSKGRRRRAGTIRASDIQQRPIAVISTSAAPVINGSHARRTRSGTIVGPRAERLPAVSHKQRAAPVPQAVPLPYQAEEAESDDEILLKSPGWLDADLEYLGLPIDRFHYRVLCSQQDEDPDDELLIIGKQCDT